MCHSRPSLAVKVVDHDGKAGERMSADTPVGDRELEALRRHGFGVAYRMLGSVSEAEDVAQEALLRLTRQEGPIDEPAAWITTVVTRLSINVLRSARARRESYVGPWLPEPLVEDPAPGPASRAELADSLSLALLVLLERLTPVERAAYLLREVFGYAYAEIAGIIEQSEVNSRQLVTRARKHLEASRPRFDADEAARDALLERFLAAAEEGDLEALEELLAKDAVLYADSGGKAMAPQEPLFGAAVIARFMAAVSQGRPAGELESRRVRVNGQPGRVVRGPAERPFGEAERRAAEKALAFLKSRDVDAEELAALVKDARDAAGGPPVPQEQAEVRVWSVLTVDVVEGRIQAVRIVRNPDKLGHL
jgi:RNA polymerase sigma-70 factor (ECF subfamily)